jgi:large subunit ribosomal protein L34e
MLTEATRPRALKVRARGCSIGTLWRDGDITMRPGELTRSRANRAVKTPGGRLVIHRGKNYRSDGTCSATGKKMQLPRGSKQNLTSRSSHSAKRPNRPYGGFVTATAVRRGIISKIREQ